MKDMAYRAHFLFMSGLTALESIMTFLVTTIIYSHIKTIAGWSYYDALVLIGVVMMSYSFSWLFYRGGLNDFDRVINRGDFDWMLVKPVDPQFMATINRIDIEDAARSIVGIIIISYGLSGSSLFTIGPRLFLFLITFLCGQMVIYAIYLSFKTIAFKAIQGWATNSIAYRLQELAEYPTDIYRGSLRVLYTYFLPIIFIATVPAKSLTGKLTWQLFLGSIVAAVLSFVISRAIWKFALKRYSSASS
jgi:ABC-2 type transport system permease protein